MIFDTIAAGVLAVVRIFRRDSAYNGSRLANRAFSSSIAEGRPCIGRRSPWRRILFINSAGVACNQTVKHLRFMDSQVSLSVTTDPPGTKTHPGDVLRTLSADSRSNSL